jgi:hypothetical protein
MDDSEARVFAAAAAKVQDMILEAASVALDCLKAELNTNLLTKLDGTLTDSEAFAIESRLNHAIFSHANPVAPLIRLGITVGEARR